MDSAVESRSSALILSHDDKVLLPDPAESIRRIVLVLCQPEFSFLSNDVEDLALHVLEIGISTLLSCLLDTEFEQTGADKEDFQVVDCSAWRGWLGGLQY